ncbi:MAG: DUF1566 domain-containing protein [Candidatus Omnitrophica bacterium]|nr:DUF1566 domain-containing protein [Candidatus Omnitrophota bacterium]
MVRRGVTGCILFLLSLTGAAFVPGLVRGEDAVMVIGPCPYTEQNTTRGLPKTGLENCYNETGVNVSCSGAGQDAEYADPAGSYDYGATRDEGSWANWRADGGRFVNNTDGTVTDQATGLMWVANTTDAGRGGSYNWTNALTACGNLSYANYSDWRLPNIKEQVSIVDYNTSDPAIDETFFHSHTDDYYWTSTSRRTDLTDAHVVDIGRGFSNLFDKATGSAYLRPVRNAE